MKLKELNFIKLLPEFMRDDECIKALSDAIDEIFKPAAEDLAKLSDWDRIDTMTESELDYLAWECNIGWYEKDTDIEVKRSLIKNSDKIHMRRGTVSSVNDVIDTYFPNAYLQEWFEYNGEPHYFKIFSNDPAILNAKIDLFIRTLEKIKRKSQWLECIEFQAQGSLIIPACIKVSEETEYLCNTGD